jgi:hypothetical protein
MEVSNKGGAYTSWIGKPLKKKKRKKLRSLEGYLKFEFEQYMPSAVTSSL